MAGKRKAKQEIVAEASLNNVRLSAQKARLILNLIRGQQVEPALQVLQFCPKKGAKLVDKLLRSAVANAREHASADVDKLWVTAAWADMGRTMVRYLPRAQGRATPLKKQSSHITLQLGQK